MSHPRNTPAGTAHLPQGAVAGRCTPEFTDGSVPPGLLRSHTTTGWAQLVVVAGFVTFVDEPTGDRTLVEPAFPQIIEPGRPHRVEPHAGSRFHVQFYEPGAADVDAGEWS